MASGLHAFGCLSKLLIITDSHPSDVAPSTPRAMAHVAFVYTLSEVPERDLWGGGRCALSPQSLRSPVSPQSQAAAPCTFIK